MEIKKILNKKTEWVVYLDGEVVVFRLEEGATLPIGVLVDDGLRRLKSAPVSPEVGRWIDSWWDELSADFVSYLAENNSGVIRRKAFTLTWFEDSDLKSAGFNLSVVEDYPTGRGANVDVYLDNEGVWREASGGWWGNVSPQLAKEAVEWLNREEPQKIDTVALNVVDLIVASKIECVYGSYKSNVLLPIKYASGEYGWLEICGGKIIRTLGAVSKTGWEYYPPTKEHLKILESLREEIALTGARVYIPKDGRLFLKT